MHIGLEGMYLYLQEMDWERFILYPWKEETEHNSNTWPNLDKTRDPSSTIELAPDRGIP